MPVLQRFYPEFFFLATCRQLLGIEENVQCSVALFDDAAVFNANHSAGLSLPYPYIADTAQYVTLQVTRDSTKMLFAVPEISWSGVPTTSIRHIIVWMQFPGNNKTTFYPFMHFDLGTSLLPDAGTFTFTPDEICIPNIDFDYEVCA